MPSKKKGAKKQAPAASPSEETATTEATSTTQREETEDKSRTLASAIVTEMTYGRNRERDEELDKKHPFWDLQPVPHMTDKFGPNDKPGPIDKPKTVQDVQQEPYTLSTGFEWCDMNVDDEKEMQEIYTLLNENYVEDDDNMFRFDYSIPFLKWALTPPGFLRQWHVGVRVSKNRKLVGFISAIPANLAVYDDKLKLVEINFLCIHKKLRENRLAPVLIMEITRRVNLQNIWQAVYTAGKVLPKPVAKCRYYHRSLNPKKLIDVGFSHLGPRMTMARAIKLFKLPDKPQHPRIRPCEKKDVPSALKLLTNYLSKFSLKPLFDETEFEHWFLPRSGIVNTYVIPNDKGEITDMVSFYTLPSTIIGNTTYKTLKAAYSYYNVATSVPLDQLMKDGLILAKNEGFDVFNCLDIMENESFLKELKFGKGDGNLHYYLYNWRCPEMPPKQMGLVLL